MADNWHECVDCGRRIKGEFPRCMFCINALRKAGVCAWCGEKPVKPRARNGAQSKYCPECQEMRINVQMKKKVRSDQRNQYRGKDHRELTHETKHGTGNGEGH